MSNVTTMSIWGDDSGNVQMTPQSLTGGQAGDWFDVLTTGLAGAAVNAAYNASNTVGNPPQVSGITIGASGNIMPLLMLAAVAWFVLK